MKNRRKFLKNALAVAAGSFIVDLSVAKPKSNEYEIIDIEDKNEKSNPYNLALDKVEWMKEATLKQLKGCRVEGAGGTWIHTPDGVGNYKALWTRDSYYMVEYAGDLMDPEEIKASIYYLINRLKR